MAASVHAKVLARTLLILTRPPYRSVITVVTPVTFAMIPHLIAVFVEQILQVHTFQKQLLALHNVE